MVQTLARPPRPEPRGQAQIVWSFVGQGRSGKVAALGIEGLAAGGRVNGGSQPGGIQGCDWNTTWVSLGEVCACSQHSICSRNEKGF